MPVGLGGDTPRMKTFPVPDISISYLYEIVKFNELTSLRILLRPFDSFLLFYRFLSLLLYL